MPCGVRAPDAGTIKSYAGLFPAIVVRRIEALKSNDDVRADLRAVN